MTGPLRALYPETATLAEGWLEGEVSATFSDTFAPSDPQLPSASPISVTTADWPGTTGASATRQVRRDLRILPLPAQDGAEKPVEVHQLPRPDLGAVRVFDDETLSSSAFLRRISALI